MSLIIYRSNKVPNNVKTVRCNDAYFNVNTNLDESEECARILRDIDKARYDNKDMFRGREESNWSIYRENLSTVVQ